MKQFFYRFCFLTFMSVLLTRSVQSTDIRQEGQLIPHQHPVSPIEEEDIINEIINGKFREGVNYLEKLALKNAEVEDEDEQDFSMLAYAYEVLGQHYMNEKDASNAATSYFRSLKKYPFNYELTRYLNQIGVTDFSKQKIEKALNEIIGK